ncbi:MAG: cyanophycin synthetase, partial [Candidatus Omnitrophota bacterium]
ILGVFGNFKGVEHRLEFVENINGIDFINDSKGTNVDSTIWALNNMTKPVVLIAGGRDKNSDYSVIRNLIKEKVKFIVAIGEAKDKIKNNFRDIVSLEEASSLEEAINLGFRKATSGDSVLLSPMCASFDMFSNYEERGRIFKDLVRKLKQNSYATK